MMTEDEIVQRVRDALDELADTPQTWSASEQFGLMPLTEMQRPSRWRLAAAAAAAILVLVAVGGALWLERQPQSSRSSSTAAFDTLPADAHHYDLRYPSAHSTSDANGTATTARVAVWQVGEGYLGLTVRPGVSPGFPGINGDAVRLDDVPGEAWWTTTARVDEATIWWERPDEDLWLLHLIHPEALSMSATVVGWMQRMSVAPDNSFQLDVPGAVLTRTDPAGTVRTTSRTWQIEGHDVTLLITEASDAAGFTNMITTGAATRTRVLDRPALRVVDTTTGTTLVGWDTVNSGWAYLHIPNALGRNEAAIIDALAVH